MLIRYIIFGIVVIISVFFALVFVKDTGDERKKLEKQIKAAADEKLRASQEIWRQGPQRRR